MGMPTTVDNIQTIGLWENNRVNYQESIGSARRLYE